MSAIERQFYHFAFDPASRVVRMALGEKKLDVTEIAVKYWAPTDELLKLNPSGLLPVLVENYEDGQTVVVCENRAILEHLEELPLSPRLWPVPMQERAEARRLVGWFERKFDYEVNALLLYEKMEKRLMGHGAPDINNLRAGREFLRDHLSYFESLLETRNWLAGRSMSYADFVCAAHLSVIDYFDEMNWQKYPHLKTWYMVIKSRPCFRPLLNDILPGVTAAAHYKELDF
ncbi:glutathione S-transferase family protein [Asticcacaulis sp. ZE23SCel15]|uniref:FtsZ-binding protein FzlA n=1 Tax=Asticcacaulis sp. ZE23SCel15 TaxID=3059027 RepID=UPI00265F2CB1|nr:glutathione S-transferase family protein [Asticcacaulis sp. ZE23SCel15]WKL57993.1 glutathione S-transferase family protein [Asticcacaulis sp. ZE23SCel15]